MDRFVITNMRVFRVNGVLSQKLATMPLSRILDITVAKPLHGRMLGFGHFVFESAAQEQGLRDIRYVGRPDERDLAIQRVVQRAGLRGPRRAVLAEVTDTGRRLVEAATADLVAADFGLGVLTERQLRSMSSLLRPVRKAAGDF